VELRGPAVAFDIGEHVALPEAVAVAVLLVGDLALEYFDPLRDRLLRLPVRRARQVAALEQEVLEHVGQAGRAGPLRRDVHAVEHAGADAARGWTLPHDHRDAVGQHFLLERDQILGRGGAGD